MSEEYWLAPVGDTLDARIHRPAQGGILPAEEELVVLERVERVPYRTVFIPPILWAAAAVERPL